MKLNEMAYLSERERFGPAHPVEMAMRYRQGFEAGAMAVIEIVRCNEGDYAADRIRKELGIETGDGK